MKNLFFAVSKRLQFFFQKSSVALITIVSDLRNRMALSDFENSKYFRSLWLVYMQFFLFLRGGGEILKIEFGIDYYSFGP